MQKFFKLSLCIGVLIFTACEKQNQLNTVDKTGSPDPLAKSTSSGIIESNLSYDEATTLEGIASIKFQAGRIPIDHGPGPGYVPTDLGDLSVKEVIYFLEATCNYDANQSLIWKRDNAVYHITFSIPFIIGSSSKISQDDVVDAYDNLYDEIQNKAPAGMEAFICNIWGTAINQDNVDFEMEVTYLPNGGGEEVQPLSQEDHWMAFNGLGKCGSPASGDATTRLEELINWYGVEGWGGSSSTSTGGMAIVCANGWPGTFVNSISLPNNSNNNTSYYYENGIQSIWPLTSCTSDLCLSPSQMESQMVDFFNYTNTSILIGAYSNFRMMEAVYTNHHITPDPGEYCYEWSAPQYRHQVRWVVGEYICGSLPW